MKKSYKGLFLWLIIYLLGFVPMFGIDDGAVVTRLTLWYTSVMITVLMLIIRNTDSVYWINGVYFEDAEKAGYEKRMEFAQRHLDKFKKHTFLYTVFTLVSYFVGMHFAIDIIVFCVSLIVTAISTINIKLE